MDQSIRIDSAAMPFDATSTPILRCVRLGAADLSGTNFADTVQHSGALAGERPVW